MNIQGYDPRLKDFIAENSLAKALRRPEDSAPFTLDEAKRFSVAAHTRRVLLATKAIIEVLGKEIASMFNLKEHHWNLYVKTSLLTSIEHDCGKLDYSWQIEIWKKSVKALDSAAHKAEIDAINRAKKPKSVRHEFLSLHLGLSDKSPLRAHLSQIQQHECDIEIAAMVARTHHLKDPEEDDLESACARIISGSQDFSDILDLLDQEFNLNLPREEDIKHIFDASSQSLTETREVFLNKSGYHLVDDRRRLSQAVEATLFLADTLGSIITGERHSDQVLYDGMIKHLASGRLSKEDVLGVIDQLRQEVGRFNAMQEFMLHKSGTHQILKAGCGEGKTIAALLWAARHGEGRRIFYCFPTRASSTDSFERYASQLGETSYLLHGRNALDLLHRKSTQQPMFAAIVNSSEENLYRHEGAQSEDYVFDLLRIEVAREISSKITVCTVDSVLGFLANYRKSMLRVPSIANSVIVFDEVQSYDNRLFSYLLTFLESFPSVPALVMGASVSDVRTQELEKALRNGQKHASRF